MTARTKKVVGFAASLALCLTLAVPAYVMAQNVDGTGSGSTLATNDLGVGAIQGEIKLGSGDVRQTAARIINVALGFLGIIAVIIVLLGGFKYMLSGGNEEKANDAKNLIISGIIGLAIILSAWAITSFVISRLITATQES